MRYIHFFCPPTLQVVQASTLIVFPGSKNSVLPVMFKILVFESLPSLFVATHLYNPV